MKKAVNSFAFHLGEFLDVYLPKQRNSSKHTVLAARRTWHMLLSFICSTTGKIVENVTFSDLNRSAILDFLDTCDSERGWSPSTRNQRLSLIRSFFYYASGLERTLVIYSEPLRSIPLKKGPDKSHILNFMEAEAMSAILRQPDVATKKGVRDTFFMVLMFDAAARDCEMLSMPFNALDTARKTVYLLGKGNKPRIVPIGGDTVQHFIRYAALYHSFGDGTQPMFYTVRHGKTNFMSDDNVAKFLQKYADMARMHCTDVPLEVTPHMVRNLSQNKIQTFRVKESKHGYSGSRKFGFLSV